MNYTIRLWLISLVYQILDMVLYIRVKTHPRKSTDGINVNNYISSPKMANTSLFLKDTLWIPLVIYHNYWKLWFAVDLPIEHCHFPSLCLYTRLVGGLNPSEKYEVVNRDAYSKYMGK